MRTRYGWRPCRGPARVGSVTTATALGSISILCLCLALGGTAQAADDSAALEFQLVKVAQAETVVAPGEAVDLAIPVTNRLDAPAIQRQRDRTPRAASVSAPIRPR